MPTTMPSGLLRRLPHTDLAVKVGMLWVMTDGEIALGTPFANGHTDQAANGKSKQDEAKVMRD